MPETSSVQEYLLLSRGQWDAGKTPQEIQAAIDDFYAWHARLVAEGKFKVGQRLAPATKLVTRTGILDGPFAETKELIGGYWFVLARSLDEAARIVADNPCLACGLSFEIRPIEPEMASAWRTGTETRAEPPPRR